MNVSLFSIMPGGFFSTPQYSQRKIIATNTLPSFFLKEIYNLGFQFPTEYLPYICFSIEKSAKMYE